MKFKLVLSNFYKRNLYKFENIHLFSNSIECDENSWENGCCSNEESGCTKSEGPLSTGRIKIEASWLIFRQHLLIVPNIAPSCSAAWFFGFNEHSLHDDRICGLGSWSWHTLLAVFWNLPIAVTYNTHTVLVNKSVNRALWFNAASLIFTYSCVEIAVLTSTIFKDSLSQVAFVWSTDSSISLSSLICWTINALSIIWQSLNFSTVMRHTSFSILARSRVWVTLSTSSVNLKNLSGIAIHGSTFLAIPHGSCPISALFTSSIDL